MVAKGTLTKPLAEGQYHLEVKLGTSVVFKHDGSLCGESTAKVILMDGLAHVFYFISTLRSQELKGKVVLHVGCAKKGHRMDTAS